MEPVSEELPVLFVIPSAVIASSMGAAERIKVCSALVRWVRSARAMPV